MPIAENFRRRGKFEEISFIFPNAPAIPITVVRFYMYKGEKRNVDGFHNQNSGMRMPGYVVNLDVLPVWLLNPFRWYDIVRARDTVRDFTKYIRNQFQGIF